ncbi:hypothetical protein HNP99_001145 [Flavobacterium sp. 28A]|uniref:hypothetical protein n=1 Tax=Flavobacterium sp. 28A TaxID=2735895 RepID=UPI00156F169E|nr:hypothetical protein [Flavobacterium sp. 28A]NRT14801.1 hypothetical protein [Flavobacterium sp. 28A]
MYISGIPDEIFKYNNSESDKLSGLTPNQTHELIYNPLGENSCIKFSSTINSEILDEIPFFRISEELLKIIKRDGFIKLTPLGALPKKILIELYDFRFIVDEHIESGINKLYREDVCVPIKTARIVCESTNLVKKTKGKLLLTKNGERCLKNENRVELFKIIFLIFSEKFNWAYNDGYTKEPVGQYGYLFSIYLLKKFGDKENSTNYFAEKYLQVFEKFITYFNEDYSTPEKLFNSCYTLRTFERFTEWFGLTKLSGKNSYFDLENAKITKTILFEKIFILE